VETLLKPENKDKLTGVLTYHVVSGKFSAEELKKKAEMNGGMTTLKTVQGETLEVMAKGRMLQVKDSKGDVAKITIADVNQSNGVIHVIDTVLLP
jgi:uncharacterized surface protein with fasciclin (FAS1) repeats